jgi:hypothetical protein
MALSKGFVKRLWQKAFGKRRTLFGKKQTVLANFYLILASTLSDEIDQQIFSQFFFLAKKV